jgi:hypothetical protein
LLERPIGEKILFLSCGAAGNEEQTEGERGKETAEVG